MIEKNEQLHRKSSTFQAKRHSVSSSMYEEVKAFLQARIDAREYGSSLETDVSDQEDHETLESFEYDASIDDKEK